jgi:xanthine/uracil permease
MNKKNAGKWPGMGLILAGAIVFLVGIIIILFKELNIPRYWIPAVVGLMLILAGIVLNRIRSWF